MGIGAISGGGAHGVQGAYGPKGHEDEKAKGHEEEGAKAEGAGGAGGLGLGEDEELLDEKKRKMWLEALMNGIGGGAPGGGAQLGI
ncbi:MAG TPA: hypothetical protein VEC35_24010 [Noviherbaspirillum sp.]|nr:hypothetical protein [Noviherbaspirillum sp.]